MPRQSRTAYLTAARALEALATIASGENPDATGFALPVELSAGASTIGKVDQGAAGAAAWLVTMATGLNTQDDFVSSAPILANVAAPTMTRPADTTPYASGDLVANSTTAGSVTPLSFVAARLAAGSFQVRRARLRKSGTTPTNAAFYVHLFSASPTVANGDNGVFTPATGAATYLGALNIASMIGMSDGCAGSGAALVGTEITVQLTSGQTIYGLLEARGAYTPISGETFTATLEVVQA